MVITNPTHFAVALKYDPEKGSAPVLLAKGGDFLALKIREMLDAGFQSDVDDQDERWIKALRRCV